MTATREELLSLIGRLEEATEPSREMDCRIAVAVGWSKADGVAIAHEKLEQNECPFDWYHFAGARDVPAYTASIDAAMMLVHDGWNVWVWRAHSWGPEWQAAVNRGEIAVAPTAPLALCIACLKARAKLMESTP